MGYGLKSSPRDSTRILNTNVATVPGKFALDAVQANPNVEGTLANLIRTLSNTISTFVNVIKQSETTLWTGTTTAAGDITLSNSVLGFKQIKVYMMSNAGSFFTTKTIDVKDIVVNTTATNCHTIGFFSTTSYFADFVFYFYANTTLKVTAVNTVGYTTPTITKVVGIN